MTFFSICKVQKKCQKHTSFPLVTLSDTDQILGTAEAHLSSSPQNRTQTSFCRALFISILGAIDFLCMICC